MNNNYCDSLTSYKRLETPSVRIGNTFVGGNSPVRIQSMTNTKTLDTETTVAQCIRIMQAGADYVRITAQSKREAQNLAAIKKNIEDSGHKIPLIADVHFNAEIAEIAASIVDKVRINPGNFIPALKNTVYSNDDYNTEKKILKEQFLSLIQICNQHQTALRIGSNHGSLSNRILDRYGDSPAGMVESVMEFLRIAQEIGFNDIVVSLKSSNTRVMIQAYRLMVIQMQHEQMTYPLHLGVTEAGDGEDGRIKSALGIGSLLVDGIGDTIRVSLTEAPEAEIPVAQKILDYLSRLPKNEQSIELTNVSSDQAYARRESRAVLNQGGSQVPVVIASFDASFSIIETPADYLYTKKYVEDLDQTQHIPQIVDNENFQQQPNAFPLFRLDGFRKANNKSELLNFILIDVAQIDNHLRMDVENHPVVLIIKTNEMHRIAAFRIIFDQLKTHKIVNPVIIKQNYHEITEEQLQIDTSIELGALLTDGYGDGIWLKHTKASYKTQTQLAFGILQASRMRMTKTEYISCPSCGRTLFDLEETTARIKAACSHLKGLKIGIMGCIVNGPGEMADADYGYVGSGINQISLYKNKERVKKNIPTNSAVQELIALIKKNGDWMDRT